MSKPLVKNPFWDEDTTARSIGFGDLLRRAMAEAEQNQPTAEPIRFLGAELPWEFLMPTVVTGIPRGFDLYRLALTEDGAAVDPEATGPDPESADAWRDRRYSRNWSDNLRGLHSSPATGGGSGFGRYPGEVAELLRFSSNSARAGGTPGTILPL